jgi:hypothetical protein
MLRIFDKKSSSRRNFLFETERFRAPRRVSPRDQFPDESWAYSTAPKEKIP